MRKLILLLILTSTFTYISAQSVQPEDLGKQMEEMQKEMWKMMENMTKQFGHEPMQIDTFFFKDFSPLGKEQLPQNSEQLFKDMNGLFEQFFGNFDQHNGSFLMPFMEEWQDQFKKLLPGELVPDQEQKELKKKLRSRKKRKSYTL